MVATVTPSRARLPIGRGRPGAIEAGIGVPPWLPVDRPVVWFRGAPTTDQAASADVISRSVGAGVDAGVPVVGVLVQAGLGNGSALAWPSAEIAVMGPKGAVEILGRRDLVAVPEGPERDARRAELEASYETQHLSPAAALDRGFVDEVIAPTDTRRAVAGALAALGAKRERLPRRRHDNIPL